MSVTGLDLVERTVFAYGVRVAQAYHYAAVDIAKLLTEYAKQNHPWQNRTGDTERTTSAVIRETTGVIEIILKSETPYAQYLELAREGKWAWLRDAVTANKDAINLILLKWLELADAYDGTFTVTATDKRLTT